MISEKNVSLRPYNTFGLDVRAERFIRVKSVSELQEFLKGDSAVKNDLFVLGGGSNILLTQDVKGTVLKLDLKGKDIINRSEKHVKVAVGAGENWHEFVCWCIDRNFGGVENLSLIPGNVGTAPIQNIGAYGVEIKDVFESLEAVERSTGALRTFNHGECRFGYRDSIFKKEARGKYIITRVVFRLTTRDHALHMDYGAIKNELEDRKITNPSISDISKAVISIRRSKLPDPKEIGNSGSFFKNPVITNEHFEKLKETYPEIVGYPNGKKHTKVAAGWLIEKAGWKGYRKDDYGVHDKQALVLVNYGDAKGEDIARLASEIQASILERFDINLEAEVNIL